MATSTAISQDTLTKIGKMRLDDIYDEQTLARRWWMIETWVKAGDSFDADDDRVLIRRKDKQPFTYQQVLGGKQFYVDAKGRRVKRQVAAMLFDKYGPAGDHLGIDQASGYGPEAWVSHKAEKPAQAEVLADLMKARGHWPAGKPQFITSPLTHVLDDDEPETTEPATKDTKSKPPGDAA